MTDFEQGFVLGRIAGIFLIPLFTWMLVSSIRFVVWRQRGMEVGFSDALLTPLTMGKAFVFFVISVAVFAQEQTMPRPAVVAKKVDTKLTGKPFSSQFVDGCVQGVGKALGPQKSHTFCTCLA